jgi:hypothetical protein
VVTNSGSFFGLAIKILSFQVMVHHGATISLGAGHTVLKEYEGMGSVIPIKAAEESQ